MVRVGKSPLQLTAISQSADVPRAHEERDASAYEWLESSVGLFPELRSFARQSSLCCETSLRESACARAFALDGSAVGKLGFSDATEIRCRTHGSRPETGLEVVMRPYVVRQGEYLLSIAQKLGVNPKEIWDHPRNEALREQRKNHNILAPGDILFVPDEPLTRSSLMAEKEHEFKATRPTIEIVLRLLDNAKPLKNVRYRLLVNGTEREGTLDEHGVLRETVPIHSQEMLVTLIEQERSIPVLLGHLDPIDTPSGVRQRLEHLAIADAHNTDQPLHKVICHFQARFGLRVTGILDDATRDVLLREHGS